MCNETVGAFPWTLEHVPDDLKKMCNEAVRGEPWNLRHVTDWFVTQQQIKIWHDDYHCCNGNRLIKWYDGYQKQNAQKAKMKEELLPIAWHPSKWWDWYVPEDEKKKEIEKLWA